MDTDRIAIDASFLLKLFLPEKGSDQAEELWKGWIRESVEIVAPTLIVFEVSSVLRNKVYRSILDEEEAAETVRLLKELDLSLIYTGEILEIAWEIGSKLRTAALYDCFYLALPAFLGIPLWTADKGLFQVAKKEYPFVNYLPIE